MGALNESSLLIETGTVYVGDDEGSLVNLGAVRNVRFSSELIKTKVESDNRGTIINKVRPQGRVSFDWLEPASVDNIEELFKGIVAKSTVAGSIVNNATQVIAAGDWSYNVFIPFEHQDADGTNVNIDSVTLGTNGAIVLNTDYMVVQDPATEKWGIIIIDSATVTTLNQTVTIQYDYTPAASKKITGGTNQTANPRYVKIVAASEDDSNVQRIVRLPACVASSEMVFAFVDVEQANDVGIMPVTLELNKGEEWEIEDQINVA